MEVASGASYSSKKATPTKRWYPSYLATVSGEGGEAFLQRFSFSMLERGLEGHLAQVECQTSPSSPAERKKQQVPAGDLELRSKYFLSHCNSNYFCLVILIGQFSMKQSHPGRSEAVVAGAHRSNEQADTHLPYYFPRNFGHYRKAHDRFVQVFLLKREGALFVSARTLR